MDYNLSLGNVDVSVELVIVLAILALGYYLLLVLGKNTDRYQQNRDNDARKIQYFSGFKNGIRHLGVVLFKTRCQSVPSKVSDGKEYHNGNKCYPNLGHLSKYNLDKTRCQSQQRRTEQKLSRVITISFRNFDACAHAASSLCNKQFRGQQGGI